MLGDSSRGGADDRLVSRCEEWPCCVPPRRKNRFLCENDIDLFIFASSTRVNHNGLVKCLLQKYKISLISQACHLHLQGVYIPVGGTSEMNV